MESLGTQAVEERRKKKEANRRKVKEQRKNRLKEKAGQKALKADPDAGLTPQRVKEKQI